MVEPISTKSALQLSYQRAIEDYLITGKLYKMLKARIGWFDLQSCFEYFLNVDMIKSSSQKHPIANYSFPLLPDDIILIISKPEIVSIPDKIETYSVTRKWIKVDAHSLKHQKNFVIIWSLLPDILFKNNLSNEFEELKGE